MTVKPNDFYNKLNEWYPSAMGKFYELTSFLLSTVSMENTDDIIYETCWDGTLTYIIVGAEESIQLCYRGDKHDGCYLSITYYERNRKMELDHGPDFHWCDFRTGTYYKWDDTTIPVEKRRMCVFDTPQWEMNNQSFICQEYVHSHSRKYYEEIKAILKS